MDRANKKSSKELGSILVSVMVIMVLSMSLVAALIEHFAVTEAQAVEDSLAKIRVHWGMSGMVDYALSRARENTTPQIPTDDIPITGKFKILNDFFDELTPDGFNRFSYNEYGANYWLEFTGTTQDEVDTDDGKMSFTIELTDTGNMPSLAKFDSRTPDLKVEFCMAATGANSPPQTCSLTLADGQSEITAFGRF
jgi:hypothetical protein